MTWTSPPQPQRRGMMEVQPLFIALERPVSTIIRRDLDLAKNPFAVVGVDEHEQAVC